MLKVVTERWKAARLLARVELGDLIGKLPQDHAAAQFERRRQLACFDREAAIQEDELADLLVVRNAGQPAAMAAW